MRESNKIRQARRSALGLHPFNALALSDESGATCGTCRHRVAKRMGGTYWKCLKGPITGGPGTDIKVRWPGCAQWERRA